MDLPDWLSMGPYWLLLKASAAAILLAAVSLSVFRARKRFPYLATGWLWYLLTFVPMIGIVQLGSKAMADRYTYIPLVGLFIIAAWGIPDLLGEWRKKKVFLLLSGGAILATLTAVTFQQVSYWENSESFTEKRSASCHTVP
jgi:hypothetical protein